MLSRLVIVLLVVVLSTTLVVRSESKCNSTLLMSNIAVSADMAYIAAANSSNNDYSVQIWNTETGEKINRFPYPDAHGYLSNSISFSDSGHQLLLGGATGATLWETKTGKQIAAFLHDSQTAIDADDAIPVLAYFVPNSKYLVTADPSGAILWDNDSLKKVLSISSDEYVSETDEPIAIDISRDGQYLLLPLYIEHTYRWQLWNIRTLQRLHTFNDEDFTYGRFTPDSKYIVYYSPDTAIVQWDVRTKKEFRVLSSPNVEVIDGQTGHKHRFRFSIDSQYFALYPGGWGLHIWNLQTGTKAHNFEAHNQTYLMWEFLSESTGILISTTIPLERTIALVWSVEKKNGF